MAICSHNGCTYIDPSKTPPDVQVAKKALCGTSPTNRIAKSAAFSGVLGAIRVGAFFGAGGGAEAGGVGAIPGAILGGFIGGVVGASGGTLNGAFLASVCSGAGAY